MIHRFRRRRWSKYSARSATGFRPTTWSFSNNSTVGTFVPGPSSISFMRGGEARQRETRKVIVGLWHQVRSPVLEEFDRLEPTYFDSPFVGDAAGAQKRAMAPRR